MSDNPSYEVRVAASVQDLSDSPLFRLGNHSISPLSGVRADAGSAAREMSRVLGFPLDGVDRLFLGADEIHAIWRSVEGPLIVGEFCLVHLHKSFTGDEFPPDDPTLPVSDYAKLGALKVIDSEPHSGSGSVTGMYVTASDQHEIWFYDAGLHRLERLDLDYLAYLDAVLVTKGTCGWQYLFADVDLNTTEMHTTAVGLNVMLEKFPEQFPEYDYEPLRQRLEARL